MMATDTLVAKRREVLGEHSYFSPPKQGVVSTQLRKLNIKKPPDWAASLLPPLEYPAAHSLT